MANINKRDRIVPSRYTSKSTARLDTQEQRTTTAASRTVSRLKSVDKSGSKTSSAQASSSSATKEGKTSLSASNVPSNSGAEGKVSQELNLAAQLYSWIFMRHSLEATSVQAAEDAQSKFVTFTTALEKEERDLEEDHKRYLLEREIEVLDCLLSEEFSQTFFQCCGQLIFLQNQYKKTISSTMQMANGQRNEDPVIQNLRTGIQRIDQLHHAFTKIRDTLIEARGLVPSDSILEQTLQDLAIVIDRQNENLTNAQKLLTTLRENERNRQHLESMNRI
ncbi:hypothetical protein M422DRAFT_62483 [Sphaerobolus stellatus SS14]|nr:hypothetical protein M422DRAFT_62483 [Sphaerobolus stellatus SS14]